MPIPCIELPWRRPRTYPPLPLYLPLRRCKLENETLLDDLLDPATETLPLAIPKRIPKGFLTTALRKTDTLLLLDGLDELDHGTPISALSKSQ